MDKSKNLVIVALVVAIACMSAGYALLSQNLTINGQANIADVTWKVEFTKIAKELTDATEVSEPTASGTAASFNVNLEKPGSKAVYTITVANNGTIPATLKSITDLTDVNAAAPLQIKYDISGAVKGSTLAPKDTTEVIVTVEWPSTSEEVPTESVSKTATIVLGYEQAA